MEEVYSVPFRNRLARAILRPIFRILFRLLSNVQITGLKNVPRKGPYLIAINHVSLYEPPLVLAFWPVIPEAAGAVDIWQKRGQSILVRLFGGIQVHRGKYDRRVVDTMLAALKSGRPLLIAPEGGRSHVPGLRQALPGVAYIMDQARVPVVPVGIVGASDNLLQLALRGKRPRLEMHIGQPISLPPVTGKGEARRAARQQNADLIMKQIARLLPSEYHGVYVGNVPDKNEEIEDGSTRNIPAEAA